MFATASVSSFFPTPVWFHELHDKDATEINQAILTHLATSAGVESGLRPGDMWQSPTNLQTRQPFSALNPFILEAASKALAFLEAKFAELTITAMWANISAHKAGHRLHTHPNNLLSGVYYVQVDDRSNLILFEDPRTQINALRPQYRRPNAFNAGIANVRVQPGLLLLFPAYLPHFVPPSESERARISVSFNIMMPDFVERSAVAEWTGNMRV